MVTFGGWRADRFARFGRWRPDFGGPGEFEVGLGERVGPEMVKFSPTLTN